MMTLKECTNWWRMSEVKLGKIYKRKTDTTPIGVYPNYMVLTGKNKVIGEIIRYRFIDMEWGQEPNSVMSDNDIRSYYQLVEDE